MANPTLRAMDTFFDAHLPNYAPLVFWSDRHGCWCNGNEAPRNNDEAEAMILAAALESLWPEYVILVPAGATLGPTASHIGVGDTPLARLYDALHQKVFAKGKD